jgi:hypothetical protein
MPAAYQRRTNIYWRNERAAAYVQNLRVARGAPRDHRQPRP